DRRPTASSATRAARAGAVTARGAGPPCRESASRARSGRAPFPCGRGTRRAGPGRRRSDSSRARGKVRPYAAAALPRYFGAARRRANRRIRVTRIGPSSSCASSPASRSAPPSCPWLRRLAVYLRQNVFAAGNPRQQPAPITGGVTLGRVAAGGHVIPPKSSSVVAVPITDVAKRRLSDEGGYTVDGTVMWVPLATPLL